MANLPAPTTAGTYIFSSDDNFFPANVEGPIGDEDAAVVFDDGGILTAGSSWITITDDPDDPLSAWNIITTEGFDLPGTTYTQDNSTVDVFNLFSQDDGELLVIDAEFSQDIGDGFSQSLLLALSDFFVQETIFDEIIRSSDNFPGPLVLNSESAPILPNEIFDNGFRFIGVPSGVWSDPFLATGYVYTMDTPGAFFTDILDFPTGFADDFDVFANGEFLGSFGPGESLTFDGSGVTSFTISGITPPGLSNDPTAFPIQLAFSTPTADFTQTAIPEPLTILGVSTAAGFGTFFKRKLGKKKA